MSINLWIDFFLMFLKNSTNWWFLKKQQRLKYGLNFWLYFCVGNRQPLTYDLIPPVYEAYQTMYQLWNNLNNWNWFLTCCQNREETVAKNEYCQNRGYTKVGVAKFEKTLYKWAYYGLHRVNMALYTSRRFPRQPECTYSPLAITRYWRDRVRQVYRFT